MCVCVCVSVSACVCVCVCVCVCGQGGWVNGAGGWTYTAVLGPEGTLPQSVIHSTHSHFLLSSSQPWQKNNHISLISLSGHHCYPERLAATVAAHYHNAPSSNHTYGTSILMGLCVCVCVHVCVCLCVCVHVCVCTCVCVCVCMCVCTCVCVHVCVYMCVCVVCVYVYMCVCVCVHVCVYVCGRLNVPH